MLRGETIIDCRSVGCVARKLYRGKIEINKDGMHTLECFIGDGFGDGSVDSGLVVDNVRLEPWEFIPTLNQWGLIILSLLIGISSVWVIRRKKKIVV